MCCNKRPCVLQLRPDAAPNKYIFLKLKFWKLFPFVCPCIFHPPQPWKVLGYSQDKQPWFGDHCFKIHCTQSTFRFLDFHYILPIYLRTCLLITFQILNGCFRKVMHGVSSIKQVSGWLTPLVIHEQVGFGITVLSVLSVTQLLTVKLIIITCMCWVEVSNSWLHR